MEPLAGPPEFLFSGRHPVEELGMWTPLSRPAPAGTEAVGSAVRFGGGGRVTGYPTSKAPADMRVSLTSSTVPSGPVVVHTIRSSGTPLGRPHAWGVEG